MAGSTSTHNLRVITTLEGFDQVSTQLNGFGKTTSGLVTQQDALQTAMGKTQGAAIKTGQEFTKVSKEQTSTSKTSQSLGQAFKSSALLITAFASSLISSVGQLVSFQGASVKLEKTHAALEKRAIALQQAENKLAADIANGTKTGSAADLQAQKLAATRKALEADTEKLRLKEEEHNLSLINLATSIIPTVITGISSLNNIYGTVKGTLEQATQATKDTNAETANLGTVADTTQTIGIIPMLKSFVNWVTGAKDVTTENTNLTGGLQNMGTELGKTEQTGNIVVRAFKAMGRSIVDFASNIKTDIGSATGTIDKIKAGFSSFFSTLGSGLKTGIKAVLDFGKAMITAIVTNPVLLVITAISAAVLALITNFGGFRDMINGVGVAIGNAIPPLKGFLDWVGQGGNAALDAAAGMMGLETQSDKLAKQAVVTAAAINDPLIIALQKYIKIGDQAENIDKIIKSMDDMKNAILGLVDNAKVYEERVVANLITVGNQWQITKQSFKDGSPEVQNAVNAVTEVIRRLETGHYTAAEATKMLMQVFGFLDKTTGGLVATEEQHVDATQKSAAAAKNSSTSYDTLGTVIDSVREKLAEENVALGQEGQAREAAITKVVQWINDMGLANKVTDEQIIALAAHADALDILGTKVAWASQSEIDMAQTIQNLVTEHKTFEQQALSTFGAYAALVNKVGQDALPYVTQMLKVFKAEHKEAGEILETMWQDYLKNTVNVGGQLFIINEAEVENTKATKSAAEAVQEKATQLGIYDKILKMSTQNQQNAVKITEDQTKAENKAMLTLQGLAVARGLDISLIEDTSNSLVNYIKTHNLAANSVDDVNARLGVLIATRQEDVKSSDLEVKAQTALLATMDKVPPVVGMTAKGLQSLVQVYDDTANAAGIAADSVGLWYAELKKGDAVNVATKDKLLELATSLGITIPQAILDRGIPAIKEFIQETTGLGDAAEKAAQRARDAFDSIAQKGQEGLAGLINEDLIKGDLDEVIEKIEETGRSLDQLSVQSVVIKPLLETVDFEDDLTSLSELMGEEWAELDLSAKDGGDQVMQTFFDGLTETYGSEVQPLIGTMDTMWDNIQRENPGKTGNELLQIFMDSMNKPSEMERLTGGLAQSGANGFASGSHYFATAGEKAMYELMKSWDPAGAEAYAKGHEIGGNVPKGAAAGIKNLSGTPAEEMRNMGMLMIGQLNLILDSEVNTTLPGYVTLFGQKFTEMGNSAANLATAAQTHFTNITTYMQTMWDAFTAYFADQDSKYGLLDQKILTFATNTGTNFTLITDTHLANLRLKFEEFFVYMQEQLGLLDQKILALAENTTVNFGTIDKAILLTQTNISSFWKVWDKVLGEADQKQKDFATSSTTSFGETDKAIQLTETNVSSLYKVWESAMDEMATKVESFASACETAFGKVADAANTASEAVKELQKSIDALKDKTVTITTRYVTQGSPARFGGASIGFARTGESWIQNKPARVGGMNVSEFSKPELITVTPLSNPYDVADKSIGIPASAGRGGGGGAGGSPIVVTGDLYVTVKTQSGATLANEVKPYILKGFSGIT